ncbi:hypothetical protein BZM27_29690 [Paraburkholderia steynii]|uniref:Cache domain-containing protein n=1 Tax=Paraburkholderia steynii TaxID=1245441 RepID=A0A4R0XFN8_9BURK|nr:hypothetical protein BZM27_29690 [Paraburkholderia steynii]
MVSIFVPLVCLILYGYLDYSRRLADANSRLIAITRAAEQHALRLFDLNSEVTARTLDLLGNKSREEIRQREPQLHRRLEAFVAGYSQIASLSVFGEAGDLIVSSRYSPPPAVSIADRGDFQPASPWVSRPFVSLPLYRRIDGETVLVSSVGRANDGSWSHGVVSIALRRKYLIDFYTRVVGNWPGYAVSLYRREGPAILASGSSDMLLGGLERDRGFAQAIRENVLYGSFRQPGREHETDQLVEFRRVGNYPIYVAGTFNLDELFEAWWRGLVVLAAITLIPGAMLSLWIALRLVRLSTDEVKWGGQKR